MKYFWLLLFITVSLQGALRPKPINEVNCLRVPLKLTGEEIVTFNNLRGSHLKNPLMNSLNRAAVTLAVMKAPKLLNKYVLTIPKWPLPNILLNARLDLLKKLRENPYELSSLHEEFVAFCSSVPMGITQGYFSNAEDARWNTVLCYALLSKYDDTVVAVQNSHDTVEEALTLFINQENYHSNGNLVNSRLPLFAIKKNNRQ